MPKSIDAAAVRNLLADMDPDEIRALHGDALTQSGQEYLTDYERMGEDLEALNELIQPPNSDLVTLPTAEKPNQLQPPWMGLLSALVMVAAVLVAGVLLNRQPKEEPFEHPKLITRSIQKLSQDDTFFDAIRAGDMELVEQALEKGVDLNRVEETTGWLPITVAVISGHQDMLKALMAAGADLDHTDRNGLTTLMHAAQLGFPSALSLLLEAGANLHAIDSEGRTPLMRAASEGRYDAVKLLLERGANPQVEDDQGMSAVDWARFGGHRSVADLLTSETAPP